MIETAGIPSTERVYEAVRELRALDQVASRETVQELTGLKMSIVDDRMRALADDGRIRRVTRGVYEVVEVYPPARAISKTILPDGTVKYDIGDEVLTLTPAEARRLAELSVGAAQTAVMIQSAKAHMLLATELAAKVERLTRLVHSMRERLDERQQALFDEACPPVGFVSGHAHPETVAYGCTQED